MNRIPSFKYSFNENDIDDINKKFKELILSNGFLTNGKYCEELEKKFSEYVDCEFAISCNSGTSALELIYRSLDLSECDVLVPTNTFTATATPLLALNSAPIFYDCNKDLAFDFDSILESITNKTKAIVITHIGGFINPQIEELAQYCRENDLFLIEDCAHAHGATYKGKKAGSFGIAAAFSFFSTKVMTCGEGGIVTTSDYSLRESMKLIRDHGQHADNLVNSLGFNLRMSEIHALMAISQLSKLDEMITARREVARIYDSQLSKLSRFKKVQEHNEVESSLYKYTLIADSDINVEELYAFARKEFNIALAGRTYPIPCHKQLVFKDLEDKELRFSEDISQRIVCLPIFPGLPSEDINRVIKCLESY